MALLEDSLLRWIELETETLLDSIQECPASMETLTMLQLALPDFEPEEDEGDDNMVLMALQYIAEVLDLDALGADTTALAAGSSSTEDCIKFAEAVLYICLNGAEKRDVVKRIMKVPDLQLVQLQDSIKRTKALLTAVAASPSSSAAASDATTCTPKSALSSAATSVLNSAQVGETTSYLRRENASLREEVEELRGTVSRLQEAATGNASGAASWQSCTQVTGGSAHQGDAEAALEAARREAAALQAVDALREEVRDLKSQLMSAKTEGAEAAAMREQLDVLRSASTRAAEAEAALSAARKRIQDLEDVSEAHARLVASHEKLGKSHSDLQREASKLPKLLASLEEQKSAAVSAEMRSTDLELQLEAAQEHIAELQGRLASGATSGDSGQPMQAAVAVGPAVQTQEGGMAGGLSEFNPEVAAELDHLRGDNSRLREALSQNSAENVLQLETLLEQTRSLKNSFENKYKATVKLLQASESARTAAEEALTRTRSSLSETQAELADTRAERESLHARLSTTTTELASVQQSLAQARQKAASDAAAAAANMQQLQCTSDKAAQEAAAALADAHTAAADAAASAAAREGALRHDLREVQWRTEAEVEGAQMRFAEVTAQLRADADARLQEQLAAAEARLDAYKEKHSVSTDEWTAQREALGREATEQQAVLTATRADLKEAKQEAAANAAKGTKLQKALAANEQALAGVQGQLRVTQAQLQKAEADFKDWQLRSNSAGGMGGGGGAGHWEAMEHLKGVQATVALLEKENGNLKRSMKRNGFSAEAVTSAAAGEDASAAVPAVLDSEGDASTAATAPVSGTAKRMTRSQAASTSAGVTGQLRTAQAEISSLQQDKSGLQQQVTRLMLEETALREKGKKLIGSLQGKIKALETEVTRKCLEAERLHRAAQMAGVKLDGMPAAPSALVAAPVVPAAAAAAAAAPRMVTAAPVTGRATAAAASMSSLLAAAPTADDDDDDEDEFSTCASALTAPAPVAPATGPSLLVGPLPVKVTATMHSGGVSASRPTVSRTSVINRRGTGGVRKSIYSKRTGVGAKKPAALAPRPANA